MVSEWTLKKVLLMEFGTPIRACPIIAPEGPKDTSPGSQPGVPHVQAGHAPREGCQNLPHFLRCPKIITSEKRLDARSHRSSQRPPESLAAARDQAVGCGDRASWKFDDDGGQRGSHGCMIRGRKRSLAFMHLVFDAECSKSRQ